MKDFKSFMSEGTVKFDQHDGEDEDFIKLTKSLGLKVKTKGDETVVSGNDGKINKMLKTMNMKKDEDGYLWLLGRADDVLKVAGHRIGTAELESCIVSHNDVAESAVCGIPDDVKGEVIIAYVVLKNGIITDKSILEKNLYHKIRSDVGAIATPKEIYFVSKLPKTRSGKIMRRLLKSIASGEKIGDVSTLDDPSAVVEIQKTVIEN